MRTNKKLMLVSAVATALFVSIAVVYQLVENADPCNNNISTQATSPDGLYIATLFERDCGATTNFNRQISLRRSGTLFSYKAEDKIVTVEGQPKLRMIWKTKTNLVVYGATNVGNTTILKKPLWRDVTINYH